MGWLWSAISSGAMHIALGLAKVVGVFITKAIVVPLVRLVNLLLSITVFNPESLGRGSVFGQAATDLWNVMMGVSAGVVLVMVVWNAFQMHLGTITNRGRKWPEIAEGVAIYGLMTAGGYEFIVTMLNLNNVFVKTMMSATGKLILGIGNANPTVGGVALATAIPAIAMLGDMLMPLIELAIVVLVLWAVITWAYRLFEMVFFTGMLPLTAAIASGGYRNALDWNVREVMGAVFTQTAMVLVWYTTWLIIGGKFTGQGAGLVNLVVGVAGFYSMTKAPAWLQGIIGHRHTGQGSIAAGVFAGSMLASGARSMLRATPVGAAAGQIMRARTAKAEAQVASWGNRQTVGEQTGLSGLAQGIKSRVASSSVGQRAQAVGQRMREDFQAADETMAGIPLAGAVYGGFKDVVKGTAGVAGQAVGAVRNAGSYAIQPRTTLGRHVQRAYADAAVARESAGGVRAAAVTGAVGAKAAMAQEGVPQDELQRRLGATAETGYSMGEPQRGVFLRARRASRGRRPAGGASSGSSDPKDPVYD